MKKNREQAITNKEVVFRGIPASPGISIGPCLVYEEPAWEPEPRTIVEEDIHRELKRFRTSVENIHLKLNNSFKKNEKLYGPSLGEILELQIAFLEDQSFLKEVEDTIEGRLFDAAYSTFKVLRKKKEHFLRMKNEYFRERAFDIQYLKEQLVKNMLGSKYERQIIINEPVIVITENLSPADIVQLHRQKVPALCTASGGKMSHMAIVTRSLGMPAVVGVERVIEKIGSGQTVIVDGGRGKIIVNPLPETVARYQEQKQKLFDMEARLLKESAHDTRTRDGKPIAVLSNIEFEDELDHILQVKADGIGLFRTEGLFLNRPDLPSEDEQAEIYTLVAQRMHPRRVVIRTLDSGGDKVLPGLLKGDEENPFLGWRAIRFWLDHEEGFMTQLKAILRSNKTGNVQILLPMISGVTELVQAKALLARARQALIDEGHVFQEDIAVGIMIEIPSVVVLADTFAGMVDFFSIGTNDLVQYTLAVDRGNEKVARLYSHFHPAILRMVEMSVAAGRRAGIPVGMCGEMAGDPLAIPLLIAMGFEELSASHNIIPEIRKIIRELTIEECRALHRDVMSATTTADTIHLVHHFAMSRFPEMFPAEG